MADAGHLRDQAQHFQRVLAEQQADHDHRGDAAQAQATTAQAAAAPRGTAYVHDLVAAPPASPLHAGLRLAASAMIVAAAGGRRKTSRDAGCDGARHAVVICAA